MPKKRVYEIAKEEGLPSSFVLQRLLRAGGPVKRASSTVDVAEALNIINPNRYPKPPAPEPAPEPAGDGAAARPAAPRQPARPRTRKPAAVEETPAPAPARPEPVQEAAPV